jgi:SAM-dependent methyltransferase
MSGVTADDGTKLREMISGYMVSQVIFVAAALGLADLLGAGGMSAEALASATGTHSPSLTRLLRVLIAWGLLEEPEAGCLKLTAAGALLRTDVPGSLRNLALMLGGETTWRAWGDLPHSVRTGATAFEHVFGMGAFQYLALHPERSAIFDAYMADLTRRSTAAILASHDFARYRRIVDVGGGNGTLLSSILAAVSEAEGSVFDTKAGVEGAGRRLEQAGVAGRCRIIAGDFLAAVPEGGDTYILKSILHDWEDDRAVVILQNCRRAMRPDSMLLVVERLLPERTECSDAHQEVMMMDMHMLVVQGGRERTTGHYARLFAAAGLKLIGTGSTGSSFVIMEVSKADAFATCRGTQEVEEKP